MFWGLKASQVLSISTNVHNAMKMQNNIEEVKEIMLHEVDEYVTEGIGAFLG